MVFFSAAFWNCDIRLDRESFPKILGVEPPVVIGGELVARGDDSSIFDSFYFLKIKLSLFL